VAWQTEPGVYAGPAKTGTAAAAQFDSLVGVTSTQILDFAATDTWRNIEGPAWMLNPHSGQQARLEYSLPMFPTSGSNSLEACASGDYNGHWTSLAKNLVAAKLPNTVVRPGWEFNGSWYTWSAIGKPDAYIGCFRQIVTAMRAVPNQYFTFDWNPALGDSKMAPDQAYPGDSYVDYVGVDIYDTSWTQYNNNAPTPALQASAWKYLLSGKLGLQYWSRFAASHAKPLAIPEWGVAKLGNGHGGGDDPGFITNMFAFMADPANRVAYHHYFNFSVGATVHTLSNQFPLSRAAFRAGAKDLALRSVAGNPARSGMLVPRPGS
jgi:hypothetical protein